MGRVRIVWGSGRGPTALAAYDAALAAANVHDYNLLRVSSVLPAGTTVDIARTAPDLGPIGGRLTVVEARETARVSSPDRVGTPSALDAGTDRTDRPDETDLGPTDGETGPTIACAGLGWTQAEDGRGIVYEATGTESDTVRRRIDSGLRAGSALRDLSPGRSDRVVLATDGATTRVERDTGTTDDSPVGVRDAGRENETGTGDDEYVTAVVLAAYGESDPIS